MNLLNNSEVQKIILFAVFIISTYLYFPLNHRRSKYYWKNPMDDRIPLVPIFVIPYYFYLIYAPLSVLFIWQFGQFIFFHFIASFTFANLTAAFFWYFYPNGIRRPKIKTKGLMFTLVHDLYTTDRYDTNAFPSNHVYGSVICSFYLALVFPHISAIFLLIGFLIVVSTVLVKQHHTTDLLGGLIWAIISIIGFL